MPDAVLLRTMARVVFALVVALSILGISAAPAAVSEPQVAASFGEGLGSPAVDDCTSLLCRVGSILDGICVCL
jgi:hypothetical protein